MDYSKKKCSWVPTTSPFMTREILAKFLREYGDKYPEDVRKMLQEQIYKNVGNYMNLIEFFQVYSYTGIFGKSDDIYYGYYKKLSELFDIDCNILDVASGYVPAFGTIVSGKQLELPNAKGKVTVCDPAIITEKAKHSNMIINKDKFSKDMDLSKYDLITGIMPCEVTRDLIKAACEQNKDFYVGLCFCEPEDYIPVDDKMFFEENIDYAREVCSWYGRTLEETQLDPDYYVSLPVIYSKKR